MQALILAAGRGRRLGVQGEERPKCLLEVGRRPLVEHQLEALADAGVGPVAMVVGYGADEIREVVRIRAEFVENARWSVTNSLYSFWLARNWVQGPLMVLNADVLFDGRILDRLLRTEGDAFAYDSRSGHGAEHMKVRLSADGRLLEMGKNLPLDGVCGENVGILKLTRDTAAHLFEEAGRQIEAGKEGSWLGSAVCTVARELPFRAVDVAGLPWGEIDFSYDLDRARREVWPEIQAARHKRRSWTVAKWASASAVLLLSGVALGGGLRGEPVERVFNTLELAGSDVTLTGTDGRESPWSFLALDGRQAFEVEGPTRLRIDSRLLLRPGAADGEEFAYILDVYLDGERIDYFMEKATASSSWTHPEWTVSKRSRLALDVPAGRHAVDVRLLSTHGAGCLLRIRQQENEELDD